VIGVPGIPPVFLAVRPYIAWSRGLYKKYLADAADIRIQDFTTGADALRAVQDGQIDLAWAPAVMAAMAGGANLVAIEGMDTTDWQIASTDPSISTCRQLRGQAIGIDSAGGARYEALVDMLSMCGLSINDVRTMDLPGAAGQHYGMLVTTKDKLAQNRALYVDVIKGDVAATSWMYDPKNLNAASRTAQITGDSPPVAKSALAHYLGVKWWNVNTSGLTVQRITRTLGQYLRLGAIPQSGQALTYGTMTDTSLWKDAWKAVGRRYAVSRAELSAYSAR
jgi:ABC-type nitrate/sulfonate/bicarbonate transport system substrate-binding protein